MTTIVEITECCQPGIYKHPEWGKCSLCYKKENPEAFKNNSNIVYRKNELKIVTDGRKIPKSSYLWTAIKEMCKTGEIGKETHFKDFIKFMKDKTIYKGWDAEQGLELLKIYVKENCDNDFKKLSYKIQHAICGCIIDWWNITKKFPGVSYCYYARWGSIPQVHTKIPLPPGFKEWCEECKDNTNCCTECTFKKMFINNTNFE